MAEIDDLRDEVLFWRRDAAARLTMLRWEFESAKTDDARAKISFRICPTLAAVNAADAKDWFDLSCDQCGRPIRPGERHFVASDGDGGTIAYCLDHDYGGDLPQTVAEGTAANVEAEVAAAKAALKKWETE